MKHRRVLIALTLLVGGAAFAAWKLTHRHDQRLVGDWSTPIQAYPASMQAWAFNADETGRETWWTQYSPTVRKGNGFRPFRWRTAGNRLYIKTSRSTNLIGVLLEEAGAVVHARGNRTQEYEFAVEGDDRPTLHMLTDNWPPRELRRAPD